MFNDSRICLSSAITKAIIAVNSRIFVIRCSTVETEIPMCNSLLKLTIPSNSLFKGEYKINFIVYRPGVQQFENKQDVIQFTILDNPYEFAHLEGFNIGNVLINSKWEILNN